MSKDYIILSQRVAGYLMQRGFVLQKLKPTNKNGNKRNVFVFKESQELINAIHDYSNK